MKKPKKVSIIITTKNEQKVLGSLLTSINIQSYKNTETILVDNNSSDKTLEIAKKYKIKSFTFGPERSAQRNFGAKQSKGDYLFFLDADMKLSKRLIEEAVWICQSSDFAGIVIPEKPVARNFWGKVKAFERSFYNSSGDSNTDAARFFKRDVFFKSGGYDEKITGPEDWDLPESILKTGVKFGRTRSVLYHYERVDSPISLAKKKFYYGLKAHRYIKKQKIGLISPKTVYFLRPVFYKNWRKLIHNPGISLAMIFMLLFEFIGGAVGYLVGRATKA